MLMDPTTTILVFRLSSKFIKLIVMELAPNSKALQEALSVVQLTNICFKKCVVKSNLKLNPPSEH